MKQKILLLILNSIVLVRTGAYAQVLPETKDLFCWATLPKIPDSTGFAGSFAGVANDVLIVAGGSNFPD
jgi:hypothetical protein